MAGLPRERHPDLCVESIDGLEFAGNAHCRRRRHRFSSRLALLAYAAGEPR